MHATSWVWSHLRTDTAAPGFTEYRVFPRVISQLATKADTHATSSRIVALVRCFQRTRYAALLRVAAASSTETVLQVSSTEETQLMFFSNK